jgi:hypothetical protein
MAKLYHEELSGPLRETFEREVLAWPDVTQKKMFGCPAYRAAGTLFAFLIDDAVVLTQVPEDERAEVAERLDARPFQPGAHAITCWLAVPFDESRSVRRLLDDVRNAYQVALNGGLPGS